MSTPQDEDRVWIMDPDVLEDSARDHRDSPPITPKKPSTVRFSDAPVESQKSSPTVSFDLSHQPTARAEKINLPPPPAYQQPQPQFTPFSQASRDASSTSLQNRDWPSSPQATPPGILTTTSDSSSMTKRLVGTTRAGQRMFSRPVNAVASTAAQRELMELNLMEKQYLLAAERGDLASVRHYLVVAQSNKSFNINCVDPLGRTALLIAIENENIEMIETLLEANIETGDGILYAINEENVEAVDIILNHLEKNDKFNVETQGVVINEHSAFTPDITPIILASHRDNYEIIKLLLDRGASIPHPHDVRCNCKECLQAVAEDSLRLSRSRINAYRALASPSLICLSARDPVLYAFELSWELRRLSYIENEFKTEYQELSQKCQKFGVGLLDQTRGSKELEIILNHDTSDRWPIRDRAPGERMQLARLKLAVQFRQKRFVAHPNCQQLLASIWYEGLPGFRRRNIVFKMLLILCVFLSFPILSLCYLLMPKVALSQFTRKPFVKFLCHSASYCFFLILLIMASQRINYDELFGGRRNFSGSAADPNSTQLRKEDPDRKEKRGPPPTPVEWAIMAWVAGLIWVEVKQLWDMGLYEYCHNMWNILDFITNSLYICTWTLRLIAYIQVEREMSNPVTTHLGRNLARKNWDAWDPTLISECIFATANIFSSLKLVHIFTVNPHLGPLQISLGRMIIDILKFFFVYSLVLFAFACGLNQLFWYYATMRSQECALYNDKMSQIPPNAEITPNRELEDLATSCDEKYSSFANLFNTVETLFWSIFGLVELENLDLKENHMITEWAGKTMFGTYSVISIVVLLNMLIAMMSNSYQYISNQADIEWKFARSKLWIEYFEEGGTLPPPFNIIPSPKSFYYVLKWFFDKYCKCLCSRRIAQTKQRSLRKTLKKVSEQEAKYKFVMRNLVKRYIAYIQRAKQQSEGVSEDDVNEIKQDISAFRYELLEILRNSGYNTGHANISQKTTSRSKKRSAQAERRLMKGFQLNVDPIPEVDRFLPKLPDLKDGTGRKGSGSGSSPSKSASTPAFSTALSRFKKLSTRMRGGKKHSDPNSLHRGVVRSPRNSSAGVVPRSVSVELEEIDTDEVRTNRLLSNGDRHGPMDSPAALHKHPSHEMIPEESEPPDSTGGFQTEGPVWKSLPSHMAHLPETSLSIPSNAPPPLPRGPMSERDSFLWRTLSTEDETVSGNSSGAEWGLGTPASRTDSKASKGLEMEVGVQPEDTLL